jgi:NADPH2:quinone reductase
MKAIRVRETGGPEVLRLEDMEEPPVPKGHVRVRVAAAGLNFIEVYHRKGIYPLERPFTPGSEGAGAVVAVGEGVRGLTVGDRVASANLLGSYAETTLVQAERVVKVPAEISLERAAAVMLQGMTAHYLAHSTWPLKAGDTCLVHAAAGGVGLLLIQMAKKRGARVLGTVSTEEKAQLARDAGADEVILYTRDDFKEAARRATDGRGVNVVYDSVGLTTWEKSLDSLAPLGMLVLFGQSSGVVPPINPLLLSSKGSLFLTRPTLNHYTADAATLQARASDVLGGVADGSLKVRIDREYPLPEAAEAHRALEARETAGKVLLIP